MQFTLSQIAQLLGGRVQGDESLTVNTLAKIEEAEPGSLAFLANPKYEPHLYTTAATAVIVAQDFVPKKEVAAALLFVNDPYSAFSTLLEEYNRQLASSRAGIEQPSFLADTATVGENLYLGAFSYVGRGCRLGRNVQIFAGSFLGENVTVGDNTVIHAGVKVYAGTVIGQNCVLHAGCVIGSDGFGFAPQPDGSYKTIPQVGNVVLEDEVSIGANTVVDCATLGSTLIRRGVKLDNLVQIAHNVEVGKNTVIAAQTGVAGSARIGEGCMIGGQVGIVGHLVIADGTRVGAQAGIGSTLSQPNTTVQGSPAFNQKDFLRSSAIFRKLPTLLRRLDELEAKVRSLTGKVAE